MSSILLTIILIFYTLLSIVSIWYCNRLAKHPPKPPATLQFLQVGRTLCIMNGIILFVQIITAYFVIPFMLLGFAMVGASTSVRNFFFILHAAYIGYPFITLTSLKVYFIFIKYQQYQRALIVSCIPIVFLFLCALYCFQPFLAG